jgi:hypothetical protein
MILDQANRLRPGLLVEPPRHRAILPNVGGVHETRDDSESVNRPRGDCVVAIDETTLRIYHQHDRLGAPGHS